MQLKTQVRGVEEFQAFLKTKVPRGTIKVAIRALGEYLAETPGKALRHMEPYKYVSRKRAYGETFSSERQRRFFFANNLQDKIGNNRTGATAEEWQFTETRGGYGGNVSNKAPAAPFLWGDGGQARQLGMVGHRTVTEKIMSNMAAAIRYANSKVKAYLAAK